MVTLAGASRNDCASYLFKGLWFGRVASRARCDRAAPGITRMPPHRPHLTAINPAVRRAVRMRHARSS